jgi:hypothetical protein
LGWRLTVKQEEEEEKEEEEKKPYTSKTLIES